jgi:hypothetical protein
VYVKCSKSFQRSGVMSCLSYSAIRHWHVLKTMFQATWGVREALGLKITFYMMNTFLLSFQSMHLH